MWPDNETDRDFLNFEGVADTIAEMIVRADDRPVSIGVSGDWGVGKSSMIHAAGEGDGRWRIFEVWESRDGLERFIREDLARAFGELGLGQGEPPQPELIFDIHFQGP